MCPVCEPFSHVSNGNLFLTFPGLNALVPGADFARTNNPHHIMPSFPKPAFTYNYDLHTEKAALRRWRDTKPGRAIPARSDNRLLVATWNIANLGAQKRRANDHALLAEVISWFDLVAVQEVKDDRRGLSELLAALPNSWRTIFSDAAGNDERMVYLYDSAKVRPRELVGEIAVAPADLKNVKLPEATLAKFDGFDRNPFIASFEVRNTIFCLVNVHLYYGAATKKSALQRRALEAYAVARWCEKESKSKHALTPFIAALGDFNLPKALPNDPIFQALTKTGLRLPDHSTQIGSNLAGDMHYDQVAFFPSGAGKKFTGQSGVFDFDGGVFADLWASKTKTQFQAYVRYYLSDHRPLWAQFNL
jgi:endonuclease/exonuclease/phosphatase family metal-dependent hydrolase